MRRDPVNGGVCGVSLRSGVWSELRHNSPIDVQVSEWWLAKLFAAKTIDTSRSIASQPLLESM